MGDSFFGSAMPPYHSCTMIIQRLLYLLLAFVYCFISTRRALLPSVSESFGIFDSSLQLVKDTIVDKHEKSVYEKLLRFRNHTLVTNSQINFSEYKKKKIILFVVNFHFVLYSGVPFIENEYFPEFAKHYKYDFDVIMIGPSSDDKNNIVSNQLPEKGYYSYHSLTVAYSLLSPKQGFHYIGYFVMNDDSCVDPIFLNNYDHSTSMSEPINKWEPSQKWMWNMMKNSNDVRFPDALFDTIKQLESDEEVINRCPFYHNQTYKGWSDFFYICERDMPFFLRLEDVFFKNRNFLELTVPNILSCLNATEVIDCNHGYMPRIVDCVHVHPVKYSWNKNRVLCMQRLRREDINKRPSTTY